VPMQWWGSRSETPGNRHALSVICLAHPAATWHSSVGDPRGLRTPLVEARGQDYGRVLVCPSCQLASVPSCAVQMGGVYFFGLIPGKSGDGSAVVGSEIGSFGARGWTNNRECRQWERVACLVSTDGGLASRHYWPPSQPHPPSGHSLPGAWLLPNPGPGSY